MSRIKPLLAWSTMLCGLAIVAACGPLDIFRYTQYHSVYAYTAVTYYGPESWGSAPDDKDVGEALHRQCR